MEDGTSWMVSNYDMECWAGEHWDYFISVWPFGALIALGIPIWLFLTVKKLKHRSVEQTAGRIVKVFTYGYKEARQNNDLVLLFKRCAMMALGATLAKYS
jgi:hypothetical protein